MVFRVIEKHMDLRDHEPWGVDELGVYKTKEEAVEAAIKFRDRNSFFDAWKRAMKGDPDIDTPPFCSWDVFNPYDDDGYEIFIVDTAKEEKENETKITKILAKEEKKKIHKKAGKNAQVFAKCDLRLNRRDDNIFIRNPSRLDRAVKTPPKAFPGDHVDLIRRLSNAMYACKTVACDDLGVHFTYKTAARCINPSLIWIPEENLNGHSGDESIIDTIHTDLIDSTTGTTHARASDIVKWCSPDIKHCMFNKLGELLGTTTPKDYRTVAEAIQTCTSLQTFSASEWNDIPACIFESLKAVGPTLKGVHLVGCDLKNQASYQALVDMIRASPNLVFLGLDFDGYNFRFTSKFFEALPSSLKVLYVRDCCRGGNGVSVSSIKKRCPNLKIRLVFPDKNFKSK